jgi:CheY-like chemotaxis protein
LNTLAPNAASPEDSATESRPVLRILVVDDNEDSANGMARLLRLSGHSVWVAYHGPDALATAREHEPEVVFLDIGLPEMDGYEVATRLRQEEATRRAVIIAVSGYGEDQARNRSDQAEFDHHMVKPVDFETLLAVLNRCKTRAT